MNEQERLENISILVNALLILTRGTHYPQTQPMLRCIGLMATTPEMPDLALEEIEDNIKVAKDLLDNDRQSRLCAQEGCPNYASAYNMNCRDHE